MPNKPGDADLERELNAWAAPQSQPGLSPDLQRKIRGTLGPSLALVRPLPSRGKLVFAFVAMFSVSAAGLIAVMDRAGLNQMTEVQTVLLAALLAGAGILFSLAAAAEMIPGSPRVLSFSITVALSAAGVTAGISLLFPWRTSRAFVSEGWPCAVMELIIAVPAVAVFWLVARRGALLAAARVGAILTGLAVLLALAPLQSQCMYQQAPHLLVWHIGTAATAVTLGALVGQFRGHHW
jgi:hypothetical protein